MPGMPPTTTVPPPPPTPGAIWAAAPAAETPQPGAPPVPGRIRMLPPSPPDGLLPPTPYGFDSDLQIEALVGLLDTHSERVIPLLREIALDNKNPNEARRAVFALAQSNRPEARNTVVEAAKRGPEVVRIAAIRELGRFPEPVFTTTLVGIARGESDGSVRDTAIVTLGRTGARVQLRGLYTQLPPVSRFAVLTALFNAKDDDELIRIATNERDQRLRTRARQQLRLLATPKAIKFLTENP
jgi:HEAT repeat protein